MYVYVMHIQLTVSVFKFYSDTYFECALSGFSTKPHWNNWGFYSIHCFV